MNDTSLAARLMMHTICSHTGVDAEGYYWIRPNALLSSIAQLENGTRRAALEEAKRAMRKWSGGGDHRSASDVITDLME